MKLTGTQLGSIWEISDGANVTLHKAKGQTHVDIKRDEDGLVVRVHSDGAVTTLHQPDDEE